MNKRLPVCVAMAVAIAFIGLMVPASAAVTLNDNGTGFVGKDDARGALGWTNDRLQTSAAELDFVAEMVAVATASWKCVHESTGHVAVQERRATTTVRADLITAVERSTRTGAVAAFRLEGFAGDAVSVTRVEGPDLDTCPGAGEWSRVPRSTERSERQEDPVLELVHEGRAHRLPADQQGTA